MRGNTRGGKPPGGKPTSTAVLAARPRQGASYSSHSIRRIEGGNIHSESTERNGQYSSREYFVADGADAPQGSSLARAIAEVKRGC